MTLVAESLGISRATAYNWLRRHRAEGPAGLEGSQLATGALAAAPCPTSRWRRKTGCNGPGTYRVPQGRRHATEAHDQHLLRPKRVGQAIACRPRSRPK